MIKAGEFNNTNGITGGVPKIDAIRNSLKPVKMSSLTKINQSIIKKTIRNKVLDEGTIDGYMVAAIDGTNLFNSQSPHCDDCILKRN